jgi:hypothetical protein
MVALLADAAAMSPAPSPVAYAPFIDETRHPRAPKASLSAAASSDVQFASSQFSSTARPHRMALSIVSVHPPFTTEFFTEKPHRRNSSNTM